MKEKYPYNNSTHCANARPHRINRADGSFSAALAIRNILNANESKNPSHHKVNSWPEAVLVFPRQKVKPTSISPANIRIIQDIVLSRPV